MSYMTDQVFGGPWYSGDDVEQGALTVIRNRIDDYLGAYERQKKLAAPIPRPPSEDSYYGDVDYTSFQADQTPAVIAVVQPSGDAELTNDAGYTQKYALNVGVVIVSESPEDMATIEDAARRLAWRYGAVIAPLILAYEDLGGIAQRTRLVQHARVELADIDVRNVVTAVIQFETWVTGVAHEGVPLDDSYRSGPGQPWRDWPVTTAFDVEVDGELIDPESIP